MTRLENNPVGGDAAVVLLASLVSSDKLPNMDEPGADVVGEKIETVVATGDVTAKGDVATVGVACDPKTDVCVAPLKADPKALLLNIEEFSVWIDGVDEANMFAGGACVAGLTSGEQIG